jgi:hypothetical protein
MPPIASALAIAEARRIDIVGVEDTLDRRHLETPPAPEMP